MFYNFSFQKTEGVTGKAVQGANRAARHSVEEEGALGEGQSVVFARNDYLYCSDHKNYTHICKD